MSDNMDLFMDALHADGMSVELAADRIDVDKSTFYRKLKKGLHAFTIGEIVKMVETDVLTREQAVKIFL